MAAARRLVGLHVVARLRRGASGPGEPDRSLGVTTGRRTEADWWFRGGVAPLFPEQWAALRAGVPAGERDGDIVESYSRMVHDPDPDVRRRAALAWCTWESSTPEWPSNGALDERYADPDFALAFARLVTHYVRHDFFLEDEILLRNADRLADIPGVLVHGRFDLMAAIADAWELAQTWPNADLVSVDDAGHAGNERGIEEQLIRATDRFAASR